MLSAKELDVWERTIYQVETAVQLVAVLVDVISQHLGEFVETAEGKRLINLVERQAPGTGDFPAISRSAYDASANVWIEGLAQATRGIPFAICVADMYQPGARLISVNPAFETLTGYQATEVVDENCRFLQGEET